MTKNEQIEEMAVIGCVRSPQTHTAEECAKCDFKQGMCNAYRHAEALYEAGYRKIDKDSVVMSREEYEMLKSLYDTQKGAIMTSSIGDLPLTVEGLRKAVDEITRLNRVETELQELNAKYYNEAKDLRRELKQTCKETAEKIFEGDIVKSPNGTQGFIEWQNAECAFLVNIGDDWQTMDDCPYEVVGNIYDNEEEE